MPIQIQAPDGSIAEFPDGTPDDVIEGVMRKEYGVEEQPSAGNADRWGTAYQAADTVTMGGSTKLGAAGGALVDSLFSAARGDGWNYLDAYNQNLEQARADQAAYSNENPYRSGAGTAAGVTLGVTSLPVLGRGLLGAAGTGAVYGTAGGALQDADSLGERATNSLLGTVTGAGIGSAGYGLAKGALLGIRKAGDVLSIMRAPPEIKALSQIQKTADDVAGPYNAMSLSRHLNELGPDAINADVLGKRGAALGRGAANINPEAREVLEGTLNARKSSQNIRLATDIESAADLPVGNTKNVEALKKEAYEAVSPEINRAYRAMREAGYDLSLAPYDDIINSPMGRAAKAKALQSVRNRNFDQPARESDGFLGRASKKVNPGSVANRAVREMGSPLGPRPRKPVDLVDFIKSKGGVSDFKGELKALDAKQIRGLVKEGGISLDQARELAAREGFLDYRFGNSDRAVAESTVADFLDAIDDNVRGNPVFSSRDLYEADQWRMYKDAQASRAEIWEAAKRVADEANGQTINDDVLRGAVSRVIERGDDPAVALEDALYEDFLKFGLEPRDVPGGIFEKNDRNYSNAALLDEIKRALDDVSSSASRAGLNNKAGQASGMSKALRERMDAQMQGDEYAVARGLREKAYRADEAFDIGGLLGSPRVGLGVPQQAMKIAPEFQPNVAKGYGSTKVEGLLNRGSTEGAYNDLMTPQGKQATAAALGPKAKIVERGLAREKTFNITNRELLGNSTTARQLAEMAGTGVGTAGVGMLLGFDPATSGTAGLLMAAGRKAIPTITKRLVTENQKAVAPYIAKLLTAHGFPTSQPIPVPQLTTFLEKVATAGDAKMAKTLALIWNQQVQNTKPQMNPAR